MSKLRKFNRSENKVLKRVIIILSVCLVISMAISASMSFAYYQKVDELPFVNARVGEFKTNDIQLTMLLDGEEVEAPPSKDNYVVTVDCDNAVGTWDSDRWGANIDNITSGKVKCEVNFTTPIATLSEVTATAEKTTISLSYTASGIGTNTTCVYGKTDSYGSTIDEVTNTNCNIEGLDMDTTYYYKVCAKNATGEACKEGNIKTKPATPPLHEKLNVGDYVSMTPTTTSYTPPSSLTGYTGSKQQALNPSELNLWRVIRKNEDGTVEMVSDKVSSQTVYFYGMMGYKNYIKGLNTIAAQYTDGVHIARTRHIGYSNQTETLTDLSKLEQNTRPWGQATNSDAFWDGCDDSQYLCGEYESLGAGDIGDYIDVMLVKAVYGSMSAKDAEGTGKGYWVSARNYSLLRVPTLDYWMFGWVYASVDGYRYNVARTGYDKGVYKEDYYDLGVRPIVTLKSTTEIVSGDGKTESTPYVLG